jgi:hypothetical protein
MLTQLYMPEHQLQHPTVGPTHLVGMRLRHMALPFRLALVLVLALIMDWQQQVSSSLPLVLLHCYTITCLTHPVSANTCPKRSVSKVSYILTWRSADSW